MNKAQAESLKSSTCYMIENMESALGDMDEHGLPEDEKIAINNAIDIIFELNQKYVKLSKDGED